MEYAVAAVAFAAILFLALRRRDTRIATIKALPRYGTPEAAGLLNAIAANGPVGLVSVSTSESAVLTIEPARSEAYFRERMGRVSGPHATPPARLRRARSRPVMPKRLVAPRPRPGLAPPKLLLVQASRCRICGRQLTNADSRRRGVGPDCLRNYGPRIVHAPNPAFAEWSARRSLMGAQQAAWQSLLDELFVHLMQRFEAEMQNWERAGRVAA